MEQTKIPRNRNALLRHRVIDMCLQNRRRRWTWEDLLHEVNKALIEENPKSEGVKKGTIYEDLKDIETRIHHELTALPFSPGDLRRHPPPSSRPQPALA